jgi:hypothetical protein
MSLQQLKNRQEEKASHFSLDLPRPILRMRSLRALLNQNASQSNFHSYFPKKVLQMNLLLNWNQSREKV